MILNNAPQAEAVLSNVGEVGEFRIRNSAKAFSILSSGLYANKIRAIVRELSCNAIDSHVAAGNTDPFEVHLPTDLEPYFYIRDFGTGLNHEQVTNIYTTYFESTKTDSNAFIGALGLGSKSPFSYTDNFTVTAIKDGRKGIYTAFINDAGVPSIALMAEEQTTEHNGVEVRFAVAERHEFHKFAEESCNVYKWFKQVPNITGQKLTIDPIDYESKDIVPGVHTLSAPVAYRTATSFAIMGNIAYPINVPDTDKTLGDLRNLLSCNLVIEFGIGELDFQASREGLSYIPLTVNSIQKKLQELNVSLVKVLAKEADAISDYWERSQFLYKKKKVKLWSSAVNDYVTQTKFPLFDTQYQYGSRYSLDVRDEDLKALNIQVRGFTHRRGEKTCSTYKPSRKVFNKVDANGRGLAEDYHSIDIDPSSYFIVNDLKIGAIERTKYHFRNNEMNKDVWSREVFILEKCDKAKTMDIVGFFKLIHNPPKSQRIDASKLDEKPRESSGGNGIGKNVTIMKLEKRGGYSYRMSTNQLVWRPAGNLDEFDDTKTYYYVPLTGFTPIWNKLHSDYSIHGFVQRMADSSLPELAVTVHGVRKADLPTILGKKNWVNAEEYVAKQVGKIASKVDLALVLSSVDRTNVFNYNFAKLVDKIENDKSPAKVFLNDFVGLPIMSGVHHLRYLMNDFGITNNSSLDISALTKVYNDKIEDFNNRYPLVDKLSHRVNEGDVSEYINLIDFKKGV